jgi:hypothetical protein
MKQNLLAKPAGNSSLENWRLATLFAVMTVVIGAGLFYYWFALADRYVIFLYNHDMYPSQADTSPFSRITSSRYWMSGLVVSGVVLVLYTSINLVLGRLVAGYRPPSWWQVWSLSAVPLAIFIPILTMNANQPVLPLANALIVTLVTLVGLALALSPGRIAAQSPAGLFTLALDGFGLTPILYILSQIPRLIELSARGLVGFLVVAILGVAAGFFLLLLSTIIYKWRQLAIPGSSRVFIAGLCVAYPLMALVHHLYVGLTDGYFYISDSDNFFARNLWPNLLALIVAAGIASAMTNIRRRQIVQRPLAERKIKT